jgi:hypothetical protein
LSVAPTEPDPHENVADEAHLRLEWNEGPDEGAPEGSWLALDDDDLLLRIDSVSAQQDEDDSLLEVVASHRHFFVRQEAAKKIREVDHLKVHSGDRHIGQILVRGMTRREDVEYLELIVRESRHIEVKKAAEAQLRLIRGEALPQPLD